MPAMTSTDSSTATPALHVWCTGLRSDPHPKTDVQPQRRRERWVYDCKVCGYDQSIGAVPGEFEGASLDLHELACLITAGRFS